MRKFILFLLFTQVGYAQTTNIRVKNFNNIQMADQLSGANSGARIAAGLANLPSTGGVVDDSGDSGNQAWSSCPFTGITKNAKVKMSNQTIALSVDCTVPSNIILETTNVIVNKSAGKSLIISGSLLMSGGNLFSTDGNTVLSFPITTKTVIGGQLGIGGQPNLQNFADIAGSWSGTADAIGLAITTRLTPVAFGANTSGIDVVPTIIAGSLDVAYGMGAEFAPSFTRTGTKQFGRIVSGIKVREIDIPVNVLMPYSASGPFGGYPVGQAFGIFVQPPTNAGAYTQYMYAAAFIGRVGLVGEADIRFQDDISATKATIARSTAAGQYISGSAIHDLTIAAYDPINLVPHNLLLTTNGEYQQLTISSLGAIKFSNSNGAHGDVVFNFSPGSFGSKGSFTFGSSGASGNSPFYIDFPSMNATSGGADHYLMQLASSGTTTFTSGAATRAAGLRISAPQFALSGGATIANSFTLNIAGPPSAGTAKGAAWFEAGDVIVGGGALATNATSGFFHVSSTTGLPTGVPANIIAADIPMVYRTDTSKLYCYNGGWALCN